MKAITIPVSGWGRGQKCAHCRRTIKPGDVGLVHRLLGGTRAYRWDSNALWWHKSCIEEICSQAPQGAKDYKTVFEELKEAAHRGDLDYEI